MNIRVGGTRDRIFMLFLGRGRGQEMERERENEETEGLKDEK